jgi:3-oxoadipate enol-lactonase
VERPIRLLDPGARQLAYTLEGPAGAPVVMFSNSLGTALSSWQAQAEALSRHVRVLRYDTRGHGMSGLAGAQAHSPGRAYTLAQLGGDVLRLLDALDIETVDFCGISMGGLTGLWLGVHAGPRLRRLVVANSAARIGTEEGWTARAEQVLAHGMGPVAAGAAGRWFTPDFRARAPTAVDGLVGQLQACDPRGYAACCLALAQADLREEVARISVPTLLVAGREDSLTTVDDARWLQARIAAARCVELPASHLSSVETEAEFTRHLQRFLG